MNIQMYTLFLNNKYIFEVGGKGEDLVQIKDLKKIAGVV